MQRAFFGEPRSVDVLEGGREAVPRLHHGDAAGQDVLDGAAVKGGMMEAVAVALPRVPIKLGYRLVLLAHSVVLAVQERSSLRYAPMEVWPAHPRYSRILQFYYVGGHSVVGNL